eukprot:gene2025-1532_t
MMYPYSCKCPNNCFTELGNGVCFDKCVCCEGWKGKDCGSVKCPENTCPGKSFCKISNNEHFCRCNHGYTGSDCSTKIPNFSTLPYGENRQDNREYYSKNEIYKDNHPLFNLSSISIFRVQMKNSHYLRMINPTRAFTNKWVPMNLTFSNGNKIIKMDNSKIRIKGNSGRFLLVKNFKMNFANNDFFGIKKVSLKNSGENGFGTRYVIPFDMHRSFKIPSQRSTFAMLYIKDVKFSLYWIGEEVDQDFISARYNEDYGSLYQGRMVSASLAYKGDDPQIYKDLTAERMGFRVPVYDQISVNSTNYLDLLDLIKKINSSRNFESEITKVLDVERFLTYLAIEACTCTTDSYSFGYHNYYIYKNPETGKFEFIPYDTTWSFQRKKMRNSKFKDWADTTALDWSFYSFSNDKEKFVVLTGRILKSPLFMKIYREKLILVIKRIFNPNSKLIERISQLQSFLFQEIRKEYMNRLYIDYLTAHHTNPFLKTEMTWFNMMEGMKEFVRKRYSNLIKELNIQ